MYLAIFNDHTQLLETIMQRKQIAKKEFHIYICRVTTEKLSVLPSWAVLFSIAMICFESCVLVLLTQLLNHFQQFSGCDVGFDEVAVNSGQQLRLGLVVLLEIGHDENLAVRHQISFAVPEGV